MRVVRRKKRRSRQTANLEAAFKLADKVDPMLAELMLASLQRKDKAV